MRLVSYLLKSASAYTDFLHVFHSPLLSLFMVNCLIDLNHPSSFSQAGVSEVIYFVEKRLSDSDIAYVASHKLLSMAGVQVSLPVFLCTTLQILNLSGT